VGSSIPKNKKLISKKEKTHPLIPSQEGKIKILFPILYFIFFFSSLLFYGCECVPGIDTPKVIEPVDFANVLFINAMPDVDVVDVWSTDHLVLGNLSYDNNQNIYKKIGAGSSNIKFIVQKDSSIIFNSTTELQKDENYTFIGYGRNDRIKGMLMSDSIDSYSANNAYIRFAHVSDDAPAVKFIISSYPINPALDYGLYSGIYPVPIGKYSISVNDTLTNSTLAKIDTLDIKAGSLYNLILRGHFTGSQTRKLECIIIEIKK
jgi:Domain of unknown function (DUF4397)